MTCDYQYYDRNILYAVGATWKTQMTCGTLSGDWRPVFRNHSPFAGQRFPLSYESQYPFSPGGAVVSQARKIGYSLIHMKHRFIIPP